MFDPVKAIKTLHPGYVFRDAGSGRYVTRLYALLHPSTTVSERASLKDSGDVR